MKFPVFSLIVLSLSGIAASNFVGELYTTLGCHDTLTHVSDTVVIAFSILSCASICTGTDGCVSFSHKSETSECSLSKGLAAGDLGEVYCKFDAQASGDPGSPTTTNGQSETTTNEQTAEPTTGQVTVCPTGSGYEITDDALLVNYCVKFHTVKQTYVDANQTCRSEQGHLILFTDQAMFDAILPHIQTHYADDVWIDGYDENLDNTFYDWNGDPMSYFAWTPLHPGTPGSDYCLACRSYWGFLMGDRTCTQLENFICQIDL